MRTACTCCSVGVGGLRPGGFAPSTLLLSVMGFRVYTLLPPAAASLLLAPPDVGVWCLAHRVHGVWCLWWCLPHSRLLPTMSMRRALQRLGSDS